MLLTALFQHSMTPPLHHSVLSFDHPVRAKQHRLRDRYAERLGRFHVDHQLELRRLLDWQIRGLRALEDLVHVGGGAPELSARSGP